MISEFIHSRSSLSDLNPKYRAKWRRYGVAVGAVALACVLREACTPVWGPTTKAFVFFWPIVVLSAWYGGLGPGIVALSLSALVADWCFIASRYSLISSSLPAGLELPFFIGGELLLILVIEKLHDANARARAALAERERVSHNLERLVSERTAAIQEKASRLAEAEALARLGSWDWDIERDVIVWSDELYRIHGLSRDRFQATLGGFLACVHPEDRERVRSVGEHLSRTGQPVDAVHRIVRPDGSVRTLHARCQAMRDPSGKIVRVFGTSQDVTEEKEREERERSRQAIEESQARLSATLEQLPLGVGVVDAQGRPTITNARMRKFAPLLPRGDQTGIPRWRALREDGSPVPSQDWPIARALRGESVLPGLQMLFSTDEGNEIWTRVSSVPLRGSDGKIVGAINTVEDINAIKSGEAALRESEERFRAAIESAPHAKVMIGNDSRIVLVNAQAEILFGYSRGELLGQNVELLVPERLREDYRAVRRAFLAAPERRSTGPGVGIYVRRKDGSEVAVEISLSPIFADERQFFLASIVDVTERRKFERRQSALAELSRIMSEPLDFSKRLARIPLYLSTEFADWCVIDLMNLSGEIVRAVVGHRDPARTQWACETLGGLKLDRARPSGAPRVIATGQAELYPELTGAALEAIGQDDRHIAFLRAIQACSGVIVPLRAASRTLGALVLVRCASLEPFDTTDLETAKAMADRIGFLLENARLHGELASMNAELERRVRERTNQLQEAVQELQGFSYTVAHDLRAPLRSIAGFGQLLKEDYSRVMDDMGRDRLERIVAGARRMDDLIRDLLEYSRLNRAEISKGVVDLDQVLADVLQAMRPDLEARKARVDVTRPLGRAVGQADLIGQGVTNLISNAVKFVAPGVPPEVRIRSQRHGERLRLVIEDNGIGIAPDHQNRVFGIFERLNRPEEYPGTGVGLAIVRRVAERLGGNVGVESRPGQGSRFWIELPSV